MTVQQSGRCGLVKAAALSLVLGLALGACATSETASPSTQEAGAGQGALGDERIGNILDLVQTAMQEERYTDAQELLNRALLHEPENADLRLANAELMLASGKVRPAHEAFANMAEEAASVQVRGRALQGQGLAAILLDRPDEARQALNEALATDADLWRAHNGLGVLADRERNWAAAEAHYDAALRAAPGTATLHNNRGYSRLLQQRTGDAIEDFEAALEERPEFASARENLRLAYAWKGRYAFATAGMGQKDKARVLNNVGYVALLRGDYRNAEAYLQQAMEADARFNDLANKNMAYLKSLRDAQGDPEDVLHGALAE